MAESVGGKGCLPGGRLVCPCAPRRAKRGRGTECYLDHLARSQSCECFICTRHAITGCVWAVSSANTSYSFVDKYQSRNYKLLVALDET